MKKNWSVFEGKQYVNRTSKEVRVTVGGKGIFYVNRVAYEALERPVAVEMLYDGETRTVGMRACDPRKRNAFKLMPHGGCNYWRIHAGAFCQHYGYKFERTMLIDRADITDSTGQLVLELPMDSMIAVARGSR